MLNKILLILLIEGFVTTSVEVLAIRQLVPFYGSNVVITSLVIGIFLLFLAVGYWWGGRTKENIFQSLVKNFAYAAIWIGCGLSYIFIDFFYLWSDFKLHLTDLLSLILYLLFVLAPIVFWLGQTLPLTTNLFNQTLKVCHISSRALFLSTVGSFLGAIITALILFQYLGVAWTVVINSVLLFLLIILIQEKQTLMFQFLIIGGVTYAIKLLNVDVEAHQFVKTNHYNQYAVNDSSEGRVLSINRSYSSLLSKDKKGFNYIEYIKTFLFEGLQLNNKDILIVGAGGFTLGHENPHQNHLTYVDIDPEIKSIAQQYFLKERIKGDFEGMDIRSYFNRTPTKYDAIVSDVYSHRGSIPPALVTEEYFQAVKAHLKTDGFALFNIISSPYFDDPFSRNIYKTIHTVFEACLIAPLGFDSSYQNIIYICKNTNEHGHPYTDDLNTSTLDSFTHKEIF